MKIYVQSQTGTVRFLEVIPAETILMVKHKIRQHGMTLSPVKRQQLVFNGQILENTRRLSDYKIKDLSYIHLISSSIRKN